MARMLLLILGLVELFFCEVIHIQMPVVDIEEEDSYMCFITPMDDYAGLSLVSYEIESVKNVAHHAAVLACEDVNSEKTLWDCKAQQGSISKGRAIGLQGKDGADIEHIRMDFPQDVGIEIGPKAHINYILLQVHYKNSFKATTADVPSTNLTLFLTDERKKYARQSVLLASEGYIPAKANKYSSELIMEWSGVPIEADEYTIHSHNYGISVEGYIIRNGSVTLIGRKSPQHHGTSTYKMQNGGLLRVSPGDIIEILHVEDVPMPTASVYSIFHKHSESLTMQEYVPLVLKCAIAYMDPASAARCLYKNPLDEPIKFGKGNSDEMCNFSLNFRFPTEDAMTYSRTVLSFQNSQKVKWCDNDVFVSNELCELSKDA